jgi:hypothetical protein
VGLLQAEFINVHRQNEFSECFSMFLGYRESANQKEVHSDIDRGTYTNNEVRE